MQINIVFDALAQAAPQAFKTAIQAAADLLDATFNNNISLNIEVGYGESPGSGKAEPSGGASAFPSGGHYYNYTDVRSRLANNAAAAVQSGVAALPQATTIQGQSLIAVWRAQEKALGLIASGDAGLDGYAGFSTSILAGSLNGVAIHELTHAMGRVNWTQPDIFDLYRFTGPGNRLFAGGTPNAPSYFSLDGGKTDLADYGQSSDPSDFLNASGRTPNDPLNEIYNGSTVQNLTPVDLLEMESLGYQVTPQAPPQPLVNDLTYSNAPTGIHFIDLLNFEASYADLTRAFGLNVQSMQDWFNKYEPTEHRSETFDGLDYVASYQDLITAFRSQTSGSSIQDAGATHYISYGLGEGRVTTFNGLDYVASYSDLIKGCGANSDAGAMHFIKFGNAEGRTTTFDGLSYIASHRDLIGALGANEQAGAAHFISHGSQEGRTTTFDGLDYVASYGDLIKGVGTDARAGAVHFINYGNKEGRTTTFDGLSYIAKYADLMTAFGANNDAGAAHYIKHGASEGRGTVFDSSAYLKMHPDLQGAYANNDQFLAAYINTYVKTGHFLT